MRGLAFVAVWLVGIILGVVNDRPGLEMALMGFFAGCHVTMIVADNLDAIRRRLGVQR